MICQWLVESWIYKLNWVMFFCPFLSQSWKVKRRNKKKKNFSFQELILFLLFFLFHLTFPIFFVLCVHWLLKKFSLKFSYLTFPYLLVLSFLHFNWISLCKWHVHQCPSLVYWLTKTQHSGQNIFPSILVQNKIKILNYGYGRKDIINC